MTYLRHATGTDGVVETGNYNSDGDWVGEGPDPRVDGDWRYHIVAYKTAVVEELVQLASERSGLKVEFRLRPLSWTGGVEGPGHGYVGGLWTTAPRGANMSPFLEEYNRLSSLVKKPLDEEIMADDDRMIGGYWYVVDGKPAECEHFNGCENNGVTVAEFKRRYGWKEIRRCDMYGRINRQVAKPEFPLQDRAPTNQMAHRWNASGRTINQARRRPRSSNKIKKVK